MKIFGLTAAIAATIFFSFGSTVIAQIAMPEPLIVEPNIYAVLFYPSVWADYGYNRTSVDYDSIRDVFRDIKSIGFNSLLIVPLRADRNQVEIDNYVVWLKANVPLAKQEGLSSIVGIPFFYLFDPPKANVLTDYNLEYWDWIKGQDRVSLIKQFIDEMSGVAGVTDIYWSIELAGIKNESRGEYLYLNYDLAKILKDYSNDRGLGLIHLTGSTHSDSYFINADGNFDIMGPNAHEILGCGETGECRYLRNIQRVTDKSILKETEGIYNLEIRGDFRDYPRNQNQGDKQLMIESFARQLAAVKEYKPQHLSVYYYDRITPYHVMGILYPEIREMLIASVPDTAPPSAITDLKLTGIYPNGQVGLNWRAPYEDNDDPTSGSVAVYDIRYDVKPLTDSVWPRAIQAPDEPAPRSPGTVEIYFLPGLTPGQTYYAAMRSQDAAGNFSVLSNNLLIAMPEPLIANPIIPVSPLPIPPPPVEPPPPPEPPLPEDIVPPPPPPPAGGGSSGGGSSGGSTVQTPPAGAPGAVMSNAARIAVLRARLLELIKTLLELLRQRLEQLLILRGWR